MHLVAHGQPAGDDGLERDAAGLADGAAERRPQRVAQPGEAGQHLGVVAAEAHDLAQTLVDGAVGAIVEGAVLDHQDGLAQRGHAGHRPDGVVAMIGLEPERAATRLGLCVTQVLRPSLEHGDAGNRAAQRAAHALPPDRRTRMQDVPLAKLADRIARRHHVDEHGIARQHTPQRLGIGCVDLLHASPEPRLSETRVLARSPQSAPASFLCRLDPMAGCSYIAASRTGRGGVASTSSFL